MCHQQQLKVWHWSSLVTQWQWVDKNILIEIVDIGMSHIKTVSSIPIIFESTFEVSKQVKRVVSSLLSMQQCQIWASSLQKWPSTTRVATEVAGCIKDRREEGGTVPLEEQQCNIVQVGSRSEVVQSASKTGAAAGWLRGKVGSPPVNGRSVPRASVVLPTLRTTTYHYHLAFLTQLPVWLSWVKTLDPPNYLPIWQLLYFINSQKKGLYCSYPE